MSFTALSRGAPQTRLCREARCCEAPIVARRVPGQSRSSLRCRVSEPEKQQTSTAVGSSTESQDWEQNGISSQPPRAAEAVTSYVDPTESMSAEIEMSQNAGAFDSPRATASEDGEETTGAIPSPPAAADSPSEESENETASYSDSFEVTAADIKAALLDSLYGTERGLTARSELRAEINELISQLEAKTPEPNPTEALEKLDGKWQLMYTSNSVLLTVLSLGRLPLVTVGEIFQKVDSSSMTVENQVNLSGPLSKTSISTTASFEVRSPKRLQLKLVSGKVATPELTADLDLPTNVSLLGQNIDLSKLKDAVTPLRDQAQGVFAQLNQLATQAPQLNIPIQNEEAQTWQLNTYIDEDLRIARGDGGAVFIYSRDRSY